MTLKNLLLTVTVLSAVMVATSANAAPTIYTDAASFAAANPGLTTYGFPASVGGPASAPPDYALNGVSFLSPLGRYVGIDNGYSGTPYFDGPASIYTSNQVLGLYLGTYFAGAQTLSYAINGEAGTLALGGGENLSFIGFNSNGGPLNFTFVDGFELDVLSFLTRVDAVPEPAAWTLMITGLAGVGLVMRRRRTSISLA